MTGKVLFVIVFVQLTHTKR